MPEFRYPKGPDDPEIDEFTREQFADAHRLYGAGSVEAAFGEDTFKRPTPWPRAAREKRRQPFDQAVVNEGLRNPRYHDLDPTQLHSTQPEVTRPATKYYMGDRYQQTGETFADQEQAGNRFPVVYNREGQNMILSGHHRAMAALLRGENLRANFMQGGWGS